MWDHLLSAAVVKRHTHQSDYQSLTDGNSSCCKQVLLGWNCRKTKTMSWRSLHRWSDVHIKIFISATLSFSPAGSHIIIISATAASDLLSYTNKSIPYSFENVTDKSVCASDLELVSMNVLVQIIRWVLMIPCCVDAALSLNQPPCFNDVSLCTWFLNVSWFKHYNYCETSRPWGPHRFLTGGTFADPCQTRVVFKVENISASYQESHSCLLV